MTQLVELRGHPGEVTVIKESSNLADFPRLYAERDRLQESSLQHDHPCTLTAKRFAVRSI